MNTPLRYLAAGAAFLAPPLLLVSDILLIQFISTPGLIVQRIALSVLVPAILGAAFLLPHRVRSLVTAGAALAIVGALAIIVRQSWLAAPPRPPAVFFPVGLLIMSAAMAGSAASRQLAVLIGLGALLFPLAHQSGFAALLIASDVLLLAAFWLVGRRTANPKSQTPNPNR